MKSCFLFCLILLISFKGYSGYGYWADCATSIQLNNQLLKVSNCNGTNTTDIFNNRSLGIIGALTLNSIEQKTWEDGGDNITNAMLHYRIYPTTAGPSGINFATINLSTIVALGNNNEKRDAIPNLDFLFGLSLNTNYTLEIYFSSNVVKSNGENSILYQNNGGANYSLTFKTAGLLPVYITSFTSSVQGTSNKVQWITGSEHNLTNFILQRSANGISWNDLATIPAKNLSSGASYSYNDGTPLIGNNFYRLIVKNISDEQTYSKVIRLYYGKIDNTLALFPNPTTDYLKITLITATRGNYVLNIYNDAGQMLIQNNIQYNGLDKVISLSLPTNLKKGPYRVYISNTEEFYKGTFIVQ